jgi:hypothetical protein
VLRRDLVFEQLLLQRVSFFKIPQFISVSSWKQTCKHPSQTQDILWMQSDKESGADSVTSMITVMLNTTQKFVSPKITRQYLVEQAPEKH